MFIAILLLIPATVLSFQKFDYTHLPYDLRPVQNLVGRWEYETIGGDGQSNFPYGKVLEFGIDPLPMFGARSLNYTAIVYDDYQRSSIFNGSRVKHFEYGYLPVKNESKTNSQILCAFLTTGSEGYSIVEYGVVDQNVIILDTNKYIARSFGLGFSRGGFQIYDMTRTFTISSRRLEQKFTGTTSWGKVDFTVYYVKTFP